VEKPHWDALKKVIRYLAGTKDLCLTYGKTNVDKPMQVVAYSDSDFAGDKDRISVMAYVLMLNGGCVSWASRKMKTVALSSAEAEFVALAATAQDVLYLGYLMKELGFEQHKPMTIMEDNKQRSRCAPITSTVCGPSTSTSSISSSSNTLW
jgi:hypothetical protein